MDFRPRFGGECPLLKTARERLRHCESPFLSLTSRWRAALPHFGDSCTIPLLKPVIRPNSTVTARPIPGDVSFEFGILFLLSMLLLGAKGSRI